MKVIEALINILFVVFLSLVVYGAYTLASPSVEDLEKELKFKGIEYTHIKKQSVFRAIQNHKCLSLSSEFLVKNGDKETTYCYSSLAGLLEVK